MSKSKGNFIMMLDCCEGSFKMRRTDKDGNEKEEEFAFCADATRFALADAGDSMEDANFETSVANNAVSYLFVEEEWIREMLEERSIGALRTGELFFMDRCVSACV